MLKKITSTAPDTMTQRYQSNLGRDLHFISREFERALMEKSIDSGYRGLKLNWDSVFLNLQPDVGVRLVDLAEINGLTKQGMSQLVNEIEAHGYVARRPDPVDGRAKNVVFTDKGKSLVRDSLHNMEQIEQYYASLIGKQKLKQLSALLGELAQGIQQDLSTGSNE